MARDELPLVLGSASDPAYPTTTPADSMYPGQTRAPLGSPLDEIATPSMWSRLRHPLERVVRELWQRMGLLERGWPAQWVAIHYGRIALNAHGWERLRARFEGLPPDVALVERSGRGLERVPDLFEELRARLRHGAVLKRLERASEARETALHRLGGLDPRDLDTGELARGTIDPRSWTEILLPWLGGRLAQDAVDAPDPAVRAGIALEQRCGAELGRRLTERGVLESPAQVAYLTIDERVRAVHDVSSYWGELAAARLARIEEFLKVEVPIQFWGRPRIQGEKGDGVGYAAAEQPTGD